MKRINLLLLLFIGLVIIYSYPLILNLNSAVPYSHTPQKGFEKTQIMQGDHLQLFYSFWLFKDYFTSKTQKFFEDPYIFAIKGAARPFSTRELPLSILFLPLSFFGNITAYNCLIILSFILCGFCMFLLAEKYLHCTPASLISCCIFTIMPFRLGQLFGGHPSGFLVFWIPLMIFLYELLWEKKKWIFGWLAGLCIFLMALEEPHLAYYSALFTVAFWGYKILFYKKTEVIKLSIPIISAWGLVALYMFFIRHSVIGISIAGSGRGFAEIELFAPSFKDIFQRINPISEKHIYIGGFTTILLAISLFLKKYKKDFPPFLFYSIVFIFTLILSLGPNFKYFPLYKICYKVIPFFKFPRSPARIITFTSLSISLLVGYGINTLLRNKTRITKSIITSTILILVCVDFKTTTKIGLSHMPHTNKVYQSIKSTHPGEPILEIPIWPGDTSWSSIYQFYTTLYRIPSINGYSALVTKEYVDKIFWPLVSINMGIFTKEQYDLLKNLSVKYILLHEEAYPPKVSPFPFKIALKNLDQSPYVRFILKDDPVYLFELLETPKSYPPAKYTISSKTGIFYECEDMPHRIGDRVLDKSASNETALFAGSSVPEPQYLAFGPWKLFPPGSYNIVFRLKGTFEIESNTPIVTIEVTTDQGKTRIAYKDILQKDLRNDYNDYTLEFTIENTLRLEFRIIYYGNGKIYADYVYLLCKDENDPLWHYEAEDLFHIGREIDGAVTASPEIDPPGDLIFGPYRRYTEGRYRVGFKLKSGEVSHKDSAVLKITSAYSDKPLAIKILKDIPLEYKTYWLDMHLEKPTVLEFQVEFKKETPIYVDSIEIERCT